MSLYYPNGVRVFDLTTGTQLGQVPITLDADYPFTSGPYCANVIVADTSDDTLWVLSNYITSPTNTGRVLHHLTPQIEVIASYLTPITDQANSSLVGMAVSPTTILCCTHAVSSEGYLGNRLALFDTAAETWSLLNPGLFDNATVENTRFHHITWDGSRYHVWVSQQWVDDPSAPGWELTYVNDYLFSETGSYLGLYHWHTAPAWSLGGPAGLTFVDGTAYTLSFDAHGSGTQDDTVDLVELVTPASTTTNPITYAAGTYYTIADSVALTKEGLSIDYASHLATTATDLVLTTGTYSRVRTVDTDGATVMTATYNPNLGAYSSWAIRGHTALNGRAYLTQMVSAIEYPYPEDGLATQISAPIDKWGNHHIVSEAEGTLTYRRAPVGQAVVQTTTIGSGTRPSLVVDPRTGRLDLVYQSSIGAVLHTQSHDNGLTWD